MLSALRLQVQQHLAAVPVQRKPALRRTDDAAFLLMTDLPRAASPQAAAAFADELRQSGWTVQETTGWLLLDYPVHPPACPIPSAVHGEASCCLWLLRQHPGSEAPAEMVRALAKAAECGIPHVERLCKAWHAQFATLLRQHQPLPGGLLPYLCAALKEDAK